MATDACCFYVLGPLVYVSKCMSKNDKQGCIIVVFPLQILKMGLEVGLPHRDRYLAANLSISACELYLS